MYDQKLPVSRSEECQRYQTRRAWRLRGLACSDFVYFPLLLATCWLPAATTYWRDSECSYGYNSTLKWDKLQRLRYSRRRRRLPNTARGYCTARYLGPESQARAA